MDRVGRATALSCTLPAGDCSAASCWGSCVLRDVCCVLRAAGGAGVAMVVGAAVPVTLMTVGEGRLLGIVLWSWLLVAGLAVVVVVVVGGVVVVVVVFIVVVVAFIVVVGVGVGVAFEVVGRADEEKKGIILISCIRAFFVSFLKYLPCTKHRINYVCEGSILILFLIHGSHHYIVFSLDFRSNEPHGHALSVCFHVHVGSEIKCKCSTN